MHDQSTTPAAEVQFRPIEGFPGYRVSDDGRVESCLKRGGPKSTLTDQWRQLKPSIDHKGRLLVILASDGRRHGRLVHRLVLEAFVGPRPQGMECCHDPDPNPANNHLSNLRWDTPKANSQDRIRHGSQIRGEKYGDSKLTRDIVERIMKHHQFDGLGARMICRVLGLPPTREGAVSHVLKGDSWNHVTGLPKPKKHK